MKKKYPLLDAAYIESKSKDGYEFAKLITEEEMEVNVLKDDALSALRKGIKLDDWK